MYKKGLDGNVLLYLLSCIKTFKGKFSGVEEKLIKIRVNFMF